MTEKLDDRAAVLLEEFARRTDRGIFLRRACGAVFATVAGAAVLAPRAFAHTNNPSLGHCYNTTPGTTACVPPRNVFCSGCNGHQCPSGYVWSTAYGYGAGNGNTACWCTASSGGRYKVCCDCIRTDQNPNTACGCYSVV